MKKQAFTLIELLATLVIIAALSALLTTYIVNATALAQKTAARNNLAVLNDALNRYKMEGGDPTALTLGMDPGHAIKRLQQTLNWNGYKHKVLNGSYTCPGRSLSTTGSGKGFAFASFNGYTSTGAAAGNSQPATPTVVSNSSLVPTMISNTSPAGWVISSSTIQSTGRFMTGYAFWAFDGRKLPNNNDHSFATSLGSGQWLMVELPSAQVCTSYIITPDAISNYRNSDPKEWYFEGSNDGSAFTVLDHITTYNFTYNTDATFPISNTNTYKYYRLRMISNHGDGNGITVQQLALKGNSTLTLPADPVCSALVPTMTSNTTPTGWVAMASALQTFNHAGIANFWAWDGQKTPQPDGNSHSFAINGSNGCWAGIKLPAAKTCMSYTITPFYYSSYRDADPASWIFEGSNDGSSYTLIDKAQYNFAYNVDRTFETSSQVPYLYYRIRVLSNHGDGNGTILQQISLSGF